MGLIQFFGSCMICFVHSGLLHPVFACCITAGSVRLVMFLFWRRGDRQ